MALDKFVYESDVAATSYFIFLDTDQQTLAGAVKGASTAGFTIRANPSSSRVRGLNPRHIICSREVTAGTGPGALTKKYFTRLSICTQVALDAITEGSGVSINGLNYIVEAKVAERRR